MTERELAERLHRLCCMADRLRAPGHRHTAESYVIDRDEIRDGLRRLYRDQTGHWPSPEGTDPAPAPRAALPIPSAILRHGARQPPAPARPRCLR